MPLREFVDSDRRTWQVWDTVPKSAAEDAIFAQNAELLAAARARHDDGAADTGAERRAHSAAALRRFTEGRENGWLTFMCDEEKRRLSPIPDGWAGWDETRLAALLPRAEPVSGAQRAG